MKHYIQQLRTLYADGRISKQAYKSIKGQILRMSEAECKAYMRKVVERST